MQFKIGPVPGTSFDDFVKAHNLTEQEMASWKLKRVGNRGKLVMIIAPGQFCGRTFPACEIALVETRE